MRVAVAGIDYGPRPHIVTWLARAYRRFGCEVFVVGGPDGSDVGPGSTDPIYEIPQVRVPHGTGAGAIASAFGVPLDLFVMVDQGSQWAVRNDGSCPYAYVWREGNPNEEGRVAQAAASAPIFCCMVGKGTVWPAQTVFMPFAADSELFCGGKPWRQRSRSIIYTGRERGNGTFGRLRQFPGADCRDYVAGYQTYADLLADSCVSYAVDSGRYLGSRGIEAMAQGCIVFWDGGEAFDRAALDPGKSCLLFNTSICSATHEYIPAGDFEGRVAELLADTSRCEAMSAAARRLIAANHTYDVRARTIADACGLDLPKDIVRPGGRIG